MRAPTRPFEYHRLSLLPLLKGNAFKVHLINTCIVFYCLRHSCLHLSLSNSGELSLSSPSLNSLTLCLHLSIQFIPHILLLSCSNFAFPAVCPSSLFLFLCLNLSVWSRFSYKLKICVKTEHCDVGSPN